MSVKKNTTVLLCLGSNSDDAIQNLEKARWLLEQCLSNKSKQLSFESKFPRWTSPEWTKPEPETKDKLQKKYLNQLGLLQVTHKKEEVYRQTKNIEQLLGRRNSDKDAGLVSIDIDLLVFDGHILKKEDMKRKYVFQGLRNLSINLNMVI